MKNESIFKNFTNKFSISKTLRFELIPIGNTLANIEKKGLLTKDESRAKSYENMKKTIDEYHKYIIDIALKDVQLHKLNEYAFLYAQPRETRDETLFKKTKDDLRKEIAKAFVNGNAKDKFKNLFSADLIKTDLQPWTMAQNNQELSFDNDFKEFTTYFTGFHENRKNMYSDKEQSTAIAYRIIHENLPKFIENVSIYNNIKTNYPELIFTPILTEMEDLIQGRTLEEIFTLDFFNSTMTQKGIEFINSIIGGRTLEQGIKIKGLNEYINLYNQKQNDKSKKVPKFKQLYKQILSDRSTISFLDQQFDNDIQLLDAVENYYQSHLCSYDNEGNTINVLNSIKDLLGNLSNFELDKVYVKNDTGLNTIFQRIFGDYSIVSKALNHYYEYFIDVNFVSDYKNAKTDNKRSSLEKKKEKFTKQNYISFSELQQALDKYILSIDETHDIRKAYTTSVFADYFKVKFIARDEDKVETNCDLVNYISAQYLGVKGLLNTDRDASKKLSQDKINVQKIKVFLDSIIQLLHFVRPLNISSDAISIKDEIFYGRFLPLYEQINLLTPLYNKVRNYLTQKPYSIEKYKLNFDNVQLLGGWDENKEPDYLNTLLRKDGMYYLAIMDKKHNTIFKNAPISDESKETYEKMTYKLLPGVNKMLPKVFFSKSNIDYFNPSAEILKIRNQASHSKNGEPQDGFTKADFNLKDCYKLIDFFKSSLAKHEDWQTFNFKFSPTETYSDISGFYREVEAQGYKITFENIREEYINNLVQDGSLYLFKIYNKDFSTFSKGKPNMHTLYWKALFEENNLADVVYKLNGQAEIFFRKSSIDENNKIVHKANEPIKSKNILNVGNKNIFQHDIVKDRRFTVDKFQFHVPITMNFKANGKEVINDIVNDTLRNNHEIKIIGLDRGERNLVYLTLIDQKGNILLQQSLNNITDVAHNIVTPYHALLNEKEKGRAEARESWKNIETIKELKEGYISQVVHTIGTLMVQHNSIVVMEDLNFGFKRGRFKVEKQVYQKMEKMLIDKLNYLVFKDKPAYQLGGLYKALQLTNKFTSFKEMGKQSGFLFYVPAWNTSKIDPTTGFVDFLKPKYESIELSKEFFGRMDAINYSIKNDFFEFNIDYNKFGDKATGTRTKWVLCTHGKERFYYSPHEKKTKCIDVNSELKQFFNKYNIQYLTGDDLKAEILKQDAKDFFEGLLHILKILTQLRYTNPDEQRDYILSPVANAHGKFFNSEEADETQPKDADANGAYHIALKGLWVLNQINKHEKDKKLNLAISNKEWLQFVQNK